MANYNLYTHDGTLIKTVTGFGYDVHDINYVGLDKYIVETSNGMQLIDIDWNAGVSNLSRTILSSTYNYQCCEILRTRYENDITFKHADNFNIARWVCDAGSTSGTPGGTPEGLVGTLEIVDFQSGLVLKSFSNSNYYPYYNPVNGGGGGITWTGEQLYLSAIVSTGNSQHRVYDLTPRSFTRRKTFGIGTPISSDIYFDGKYFWGIINGTMRQYIVQRNSRSLINQSWTIIGTDRWAVTGFGEYLVVLSDG